MLMDATKPPTGGCDSPGPVSCLRYAMTVFGLYATSRPYTETDPLPATSHAALTLARLSPSDPVQETQSSPIVAMALIGRCQALLLPVPGYWESLLANSRRFANQPAVGTTVG